METPVTKGRYPPGEAITRLTLPLRQRLRARPRARLAHRTRGLPTRSSAARSVAPQGIILDPVRCGSTPPSTCSTSVATVLSPQRRRWRPRSHRSPILDTGFVKGAVRAKPCCGAASATRSAGPCPANWLDGGETMRDEEPGEPSGPGRNSERDFHGERRIADKIVMRTLGGPSGAMPSPLFS